MSDRVRLRRISPIISGAPKDAKPHGIRGTLEDIPISLLGVDPTYQREIGKISTKNILRICGTFSWTKFLPVIVVRHEDGYAIVDGQHRATAAATIGIKSVPCYVLEADHLEAAAAFSAINGQVTKITPIDLWFSRLAALEPAALATKRVLDASGVRITRARTEWQVGETCKINVIERARNNYGDNTTITILQCITQTGDGNAGMINGAIINGIGCAIEKKTDLLEQPSTLFRIMDEVCFEDIAQRARLENITSGNPIQFIVTRELNKVIRKATITVHGIEGEASHA